MNENNIYDVDKYIDRWGRKTCLSNNHKFLFRNFRKLGYD